MGKLNKYLKINISTNVDVEFDLMPSITQRGSLCQPSHVQSAWKISQRPETTQK